jgi:hypothetical protein
MVDENALNAQTYETMFVTVTVFVPPGLVTTLVDAGSVVTEVVVT